MKSYGVSFSAKQCRNFGIPPLDCLNWLLKTGGFQRFRLMSYWDECQPAADRYDFSELDRQIKLLSEKNIEISLCLGAKQPRWPETHWPEWAWQLTENERSSALYKFIEAVVKRYKNYPCITSYQLENEALLNFGERLEINRARLKNEFILVKRLDSTRPIIMTASSSWGIPVRKPIPDIIGFSFYQILYRADLKKYTTAFHKPWMDWLRAKLIKVIWQKPSFIHELQLEPWGPGNIWEMSHEEQKKSMNAHQIEKNLELANQTGLQPIDVWGGEWWYWCLLHDNKTIPRTIIRLFGSDD